MGHKSMRDQFMDLIVVPIKAASEGVSAPRPPIIVIDTLGECADQSDVNDVMAIIYQYSPTREKDGIQKVLRAVINVHNVHTPLSSQQIAEDQG